MNFSTYLRGSILIFVFCLVYSITPTTAQNYYPADIGNEWVMESTDGKEIRTYTLETPEDPEDQDYILLKIETEDTDDNTIDIDRYFVTTDDEGIKLHKTVITYALYASIGDIIANLSPPVIFFPNVLREGDKWSIIADAKISIIELESITNLEVVGYEDVETPAGTFHFCAKIKLEVSTTGVLALAPTTSYQWLAPDVGPIKFENSEGVVYELVSYNLHTDTQETENIEETQTTEEELEITEEEGNQETVTVYDDMTYEQPPTTETEPEAETEDPMDETEMTPEPEAETEDPMDEDPEPTIPEPEAETEDPMDEDPEPTIPEPEVETADPMDETEMTPEPEAETEDPMDEDPEPTIPEPEAETEDPMDEDPEPTIPEEETEITTPETEIEDDIEETNPYDVTGDGVVNILDLVRVASHFGEENPEVDVTGDGIVNILDLVAIAQNFSG